MNDCQFNDSNWFVEDTAGRTVSLIGEFKENIEPELIEELLGPPTK